MDAQYLVRKVEMCKDCKGEGYYYSPAWAEANAWFDAKRKELGCSGQDRRLWDAWDKYLGEKFPDGPPPEEEWCIECEGAGKIETWMDSTIQTAIRGFLSGLNTDNTQHSYGSPLRHFCTFLAECGTDPDQESASTLTVDHAIGFVDWLRENRDPAKSTLELYLTAVYRFYRHLLKRGHEIGNADLARLQEVYRDARNIRGEPKPKDPKLAVVQAVIKAARAVQVAPGADQERRKLVRLRNIAVVETLRASGCRVGELVGMTMDNVDAVKHSVQVKGKGSKYRKVYWDAVSWDAVLSYLVARGVVPEGAPVFVGHGNRQAGGPLTTRHVSRTIQRLARAAGVRGAEQVTPHYFRHVFATRALGKTGNLALVQDMLGHASPVTTRVYAKTNNEQRQAAHAQVWAERSHS